MKGSAPAGGGLSWSTVAAYVALALLAGSFIGNLMVSRRRRRPKVSVYTTIQHRIEQERRAAGEQHPAEDSSTPT